MSTLSELFQRAFATVRPPTELSMSEWVEENAYLPNTSAKPGKIRLSYTEYQREILDAVSDPAVERVIWMASSQVGKSTIELCALGYFASQDPGTILFVQPTIDLAKDFRKERISPFFDAAPALRGIFAATKSRASANTLTHVEYAGGNLTMAGANAPAGLAGRPKRIVLLDEVDRFPASAGTEGDPVNLAIKRTATFFNRKIIMVSSPGLKGASRIEAAFEEGDQRRFHVACPDCEHEQTLVFTQVKWGKSEAGDHLPATAEYSCIDCGSLWNDTQRHRAVRAGRWIASKPFNGIASFHLNELYSPFVSLAKVAQDFLAAKSNPETLKVFTNTSLGESWQVQGEVPDWQRLYDRRDTDRHLNQVPADVGLLMGGVDVQKNRIEISVWGFGANRQTSLVDHQIIEGDTAAPEVWGELSDYLRSQWTGTDGRKHMLTRVGLDTGYNTQMAYRFARAHPRLVVAMKGDAKYNTAKPVAGPTRPDITVNGKVTKNAVSLYSVAGSVFKNELYGNLRQEKPVDGTTFPDGYVHLPVETSDEFVKQLVAEQLVSVKLRSGVTQYKWEQVRPRNEAIDCYVYARAAATLFGLDRWSPKKWAQVIGDGDVEDDTPAPDPLAEVVEVTPAAPPVLAVREVLETVPVKPKKKFKIRDTSSGWRPLR